MGSSFCSGDTGSHSPLLPGIAGAPAQPALAARTWRSAVRTRARTGAASAREFTGPDGRRTWSHRLGFGLFAAGSGVQSPPLAVAGLLRVTTGTLSSQQPLHSPPAPATLAHNNSFKPTPLRGAA